MYIRDVIKRQTFICFSLRVVLFCMTTFCQIYNPIITVFAKEHINPLNFPIPIFCSEATVYILDPTMKSVNYLLSQFCCSQWLHHWSSFICTISNVSLLCDHNAFLPGIVTVIPLRNGNCIIIQIIKALCDNLSFTSFESKNIICREDCYI